MSILISCINGIFQIYTILLLVRILGSWVPEWNEMPWMQWIGVFTDPYLNLFRRLIPPLGMMDFSPILAFLALNLLQSILLMMLSLFVGS